jgi:hypothetical protein
MCRGIVILFIDVNIDIDIFINCNWVDTRWQQYSTHLHTNSTQNTKLTNLVGKLYGIRYQSGQTQNNDELTA